MTSVAFLMLSSLRPMVTTVFSLLRPLKRGS
jgi:hypothetical protein